MNPDNKKIRTIFIGTPDFGILSLKELIKDNQFDVVAVITQPDMHVGRKQILTPPPVKEVAQNYSLPVLQPKNISKITKDIKKLRPDLIVVIAYVQIIPEKILKIPKFGCINLHASLLPKYRGAAVIQAPILNGDKETGITIMKLDKGLDTGPILAQAVLNIKPNETAGTLYDKLSQLGSEQLITTLKKYIAGRIKPREQDESRAGYIGQIKKKDGLIDWSREAVEIERKIRAMTPWPSAWAYWNNKMIKILQVQQKSLEINSYKPGKTFLYNGGLAVQCGKDALIIKKLQLEGKKEMTSEEFSRGQKDFIGTVLSNTRN